MKLFKVLSVLAMVLQLLPLHGTVSGFIGSHVPAVLGYLAVVVLFVAVESITFKFEISDVLQLNRWIAAYLTISVGVVPICMYLFAIGPSKAFLWALACSIATFALGLKIVLRNAADAEIEAAEADVDADTLKDNSRFGGL